jgi:hypothetical protein
MAFFFTDSLATLDALLTRAAPILGSLEVPVWDVVFIAATLAFFAVSVGYVGLCDRLMK